MSVQYIREAYGIPCKRGGRVRYNGKFGTLTSFSSRVHIRFDGEKRSRIFHPKTDGLEYLDLPGPIVDGHSDKSAQYWAKQYAASKGA
ncbi:hypothetical protein [Magnetococcus sp. PR-3]|uniref:hypothetical protein n=1 Tax=Magnetococcus sp. PR-3 TaxID=3120355 RepID=UPI002FCE30AD